MNRNTLHSVIASLVDLYCLSLVILALDVGAGSARPLLGAEPQNWLLRHAAAHQCLLDSCGNSNGMRDRWPTRPGALASKTNRERKVARERRKSRLLSILLLALTSLIIWGVTELLTLVRRLAERLYARLRQACLRDVWRQPFGWGQYKPVGRSGEWVLASGRAINSHSTQVPLVQPDKAVAEVLRAINIGLLGKR